MSRYIENNVIYKRYHNISKNLIFFFDDMIWYNISISKTIYRYFCYTKSSLSQTAADKDMADVNSL